MQAAGEEDRSLRLPLLHGVLLGLLLVLLTPDAAASVDHIHSSTRFDRPVPALAAQAHRFTRTRANLVTWTEVGETHRARAVRRHMHGWATYAPDPTDLAVSWERATWHRVHVARVRLTPDTYPRANGRLIRQWAAVVVLDGPERLLVLLAHLPAGVQAGDRWRHPRPSAVWRDAVRGLHHRSVRARHRWHPDRTLVVADWNTDLRRPAWRHRIHRVFPAMRFTWNRPYPHDGTHAGRRLIDGTLTDGHGRARLLRDDTSSDHRPYRERVA